MWEGARQSISGHAELWGRFPVPPRIGRQLSRDALLCDMVRYWPNGGTRPWPPLDSITMFRNTKLHFQFHALAELSGLLNCLVTLAEVAESRRLTRGTSNSLANTATHQVSSARCLRHFRSGGKDQPIDRTVYVARSNAAARIQ